jgi:hypothetical protein
LRAKLSEVKIGTGTVTDIHRLPETLLRVVSVENDGVKKDRDALKNDFNEAAYQGPRLHSANQCIINFVLKELPPLVVDT